MGKPNRHLSIYRGKQVSNQCRNNNQCPYCRRSRTWNSRKRIQAAREQVETAQEDYYGEIEDGFTNYSINRCYQEE